MRNFATLMGEANRLHTEAEKLFAAGKFWEAEPLQEQSEDLAVLAKLAKSEAAQNDRRTFHFQGVA